MKTRPTRLILDLGIDYTLEHRDGVTDMKFTPEGQQRLGEYGIDKGHDGSPPFKLVQAGADMLVMQVYQWNPARPDDVRIVRDKRIVETAKCFGYFGFGTGFLNGKQTLAIIGGQFPTTGYCLDGCPISQECGAHHRLRCDDLGLESDVTAVANVMDGEAVGRGGEPADRAEATLTWPLKIIHSVTKAN